MWSHWPRAEKRCVLCSKHYRVVCFTQHQLLGHFIKNSEAKETVEIWRHGKVRVPKNVTSLQQNNNTSLETLWEWWWALQTDKQHLCPLSLPISAPTSGCESTLTIKLLKINSSTRRENGITTLSHRELHGPKNDAWWSLHTLLKPGRSRQQLAGLQHA